MKRFRCITLLLAIILVVFGSFSAASAAGQSETVSLVLKFVNGLTSLEQAAVIARNGGVETSSIPALRLHVVALPTADASLTIQNYQSDPQVERVENNNTRKAEGTPTDLNYGLQRWALSKIGWELAFGTIVPNSSVKLALLDTGVDATHPDLGSNVIPGTSILNNSNGLNDPNGHGTSLAGIVAAVTDNEEGIAGIGYAGVQIMPVTVLGADGTGQDSDIIAGIIWAADQSSDVILMGFSNSTFSQSLQDAIDYAWSKGAVLVAATGNDGVSTPTYPAGNRGVIGVSATDQDDALAAGSNYGQDVFLAAPGTNIYTTSLGNSYNFISGTSASSAIVAGVAAFMKAVDPLLTNGIIVARLGRSADYVGILDDPNNQAMFGNGRVNMAGALADQNSEEIQPSGAAPIGAGGPFVGPYTAAGLWMSIEEISSSSQSSTLTFGSAGTTKYTITVKAGEGWFNIASLSVSGLPLGMTAAIDQNIWTHLFDRSYSTNMTVTTTGASSAGTFPLTIHNSYNTVTGNTTLVINEVTKTTPVITWANPADVVSGTALSATQLNAGADVAGTFTYTPAAGTVLAAGANQSLTVNFAPTDTANYTATSKTVLINVTQKTPVITWANPADIIAGTALSATQLNAGADVAGTFTYTPAAGTVLAAGANQSLTVNFAPTDTANYTATSKTVLINVTQKTPVITWANPADIIAGTALSATQLNAGADVAGTFTYTPAAGTVLAAGANQSLTVNFAPTDTTNYTATSKTVLINVTQKTPVITWANPADIIAGTALSATQLNAGADVAGTFTYTPAAGTVLAAGANQSLTVNFAPTDTANYTATSKTVLINVTQKTPVITWANPADIIAGTALSATQLNAGADVAGTFTYTPAAGTVLAAGANQSLTVNFAPTDTANYTATSKMVAINVTKTTPVITWANPTTIAPGTLLSSTQLNATASVNGTFVYTPAVGAVLPGGVNSLKVDFTPTNKAIYNNASATVSIIVQEIILPPASLTVPATNSTGYVPVSWGASNVSGVTYALEQSADNFATPGVVVYRGAYTNNTVTLTSNGTYHFRVFAYKAGYSNSSYSVTGTCNATLKCGAPPTLTVPATNSTGYVPVSWGASDIGGVTYALEQIHNGITTRVYTGTATNQAVAVTENGTYTFRVSATKTGYAPSDVTTGPTNTCSVTLKCGAPPTLTVPATNSTGYVPVSWGASDIGGVTYALEQIHNGITTRVYTGTATNQAVAVTENGTYTFRVSATKTGYAPSDVTTGPTNTCSVTLKCGAPPTLTVPVTSSTGYVSVSWGASDVAGVTYVLEQTYNGLTTTAYSGTALNANITVVASGSYTYQVKAIKPNTNYAPSDVTTGPTNTCSVTLKCGAPPTLTVPVTSSTGYVSVSWGASDVAGVTYVLEQTYNGLTTTAYSGTALNANITVVASGSYTYQVKAIKPNTNYAPSDVTTGPTNTCSVTLKCGAPPTLTVPVTSSTGYVPVSWGASDVAGVTYVLEQTYNGLTTTAYSGTALNANITVVASGSYTYQVKAIKPNTNYAPSDVTTGPTNTCSVTLKCGAPPTLTVPVTSSTGYVPVSWGASDVAGVTYALEQSADNFATPGVVVYRGSYTNNTVTLTSNGTYYFRVFAYKAGYSNSSYSSTGTCSVTLKCGTPTSITVPATNSTGYVPVSWGASDIAGVTYALEQSADNFATPGVVVYRGSYTNNTVTLTSNGTYYFRAFAYKAGYSNSSYSSTGTCSVTLKCGTPTSITVPATNSTGYVPVSWGASDIGGVTYVLEQSTDNFATPGVVVYNGPYTNNTVALTSNGTYYFRVFAYKSGYSNSGYSATRTCSVTLKCGTPTSITVPATNSTGYVPVSWGASDIGGVTYTLEQSTDINFSTPAVVYTGTATNNTVAIAVSGEYYFRVKATKPGSLYQSSDYIKSGNCKVTK